MHRVSTGGLKARPSLAQGNALCQGRHLFVRIPPLQGLVFAGHSFRRALPCAIDYRAFSPYDPSNGYMLKKSLHKKPQHNISHEV
jgi:hypothetical protein